MTPGCITCRDHAVLAGVIALFEQHMATVDAGGLGEKVSVELVDARIGDLVRPRRNGHRHPR